MINIALHDAVYVLEALQVMPGLVIVAWGGSLVFKQKPFTQRAKLGLLALFSINVIAATSVFCLSTFNYLHYDRPAYKQDNAYEASHQH